MQGDGYAQLRDAVLGSAQQGAPASPLGSFPELAKLYSSAFQLPVSNAGTHAQGAQADVTVYNNKHAEKEARYNQIDALKAQAQTLQDAQDPSKYQQVAKNDGGFAFYDGAGKEVSAFDYARATNKNPGEVLKNSQNPIDIGFTQDYNQLQDYLKAKANSKNDPGGAGKQAKAVEDAVKKTYGIDLHKMNIQDVITQFKGAYPTVFGGTNKGVATNQSFLAPKNTKSSSVGAGGL